MDQKFGINFESFIEELKIETAWKQLMYRIYKEKVKIDQEELEKQVLNYIKNSSNITELKISEIEINLDENFNYENEVTFINKEIQKNGFGETDLPNMEFDYSKLEKKIIFYANL